MPKLTRTQQQVEDDMIRAEIAAAMNQHGIRQQNTLARKAGIPQSTLSVHLSDLNRMTIGELRKIASVTDLKIIVVRRCVDEH